MASGIRFSLLLLLALAGCARAEPDCASVDAAADSYAARIATLACRENALWHAPFIDANGRLASQTVSEVETMPLADGGTPAWTRVAAYWRGSGLMPGMASYPGAGECVRATADAYPSPACRAFVVDRPWSAAFVSWVLVQARLPGFHPSASHHDYVRDAWQGKDSAYAFADPDQAMPAAGDLLCFVRGNGPALGHAGLKAFLAAGGDDGLPMHCDIVIGHARDGQDLYLVGGNVLQGVTLRILPLNRKGRLWSLPRGPTTACSPGRQEACSFNRQDWAALLKLKPQAELAKLAAR
ncbi:MAG: DUF2272 domain-containing protein [Pseudomonadota bacterium]|nr:DUF2272 domain-containing protein [Pseudomonadota bacterium]